MDDIILLFVWLVVIYIVFKYWSTYRFYVAAAKKQNMGQYDDAIAIWDQFVVKNPRNTAGYVNRGMAYFAKGDLGSAITDYDRAVELNPKRLLRALVHNNRGYAYAILGEYEKSFADCELAVSLNPRFQNIFGTRGHTNFLMGRYTEALADFNTSAELKPTHKFAIAGQALSHHALGHFDEAKLLWQSLVKLDAKYQRAETIQEEYHCAALFVEAARKFIAKL
jgi:Flp pilus assembly protein TadD